MFETVGELVQALAVRQAEFIALQERIGQLEKRALRKLAASPELKKLYY